MSKQLTVGQKVENDNVYMGTGPLTYENPITHKRVSCDFNFFVPKNDFIVEDNEEFDWDSLVSAVVDISLRVPYYGHAGGCCYNEKRMVASMFQAIKRKEDRDEPTSIWVIPSLALFEQFILPNINKGELKGTFQEDSLYHTCCSVQNSELSKYHVAAMDLKTESSVDIRRGAAAPCYDSGVPARCRLIRAELAK